ncbi:hypothetical protein ACIQWN_12015 [Streptomyces vinaceus]|uniref:hypothetical protein n=1 Tax=Streptomyces vinaceus TaxID=1960 RepID=UPI00380D6D4F
MTLLTKIHPSTSPAAHPPGPSPFARQVAGNHPHGFEAPRHTELIDGALVFMMAPQRWWHGEIVTMLTVALMEQVPADTRVGREMTIKLDRPTGAYAPAGIFRGTLQRPVPFEITLDLDKLTPPRTS